MFTIESVKNLQWCDFEHTMFSCVVKYAEFNEEHESSINATDPYSHINQIWVKGVAGDYGVIAEYEPPPIAEIPQIPVIDVTPQENQNDTSII